MNKYKSQLLQSWENSKAFEGDFKNQMALKQLTTNKVAIAMNLKQRGSRRLKMKRKKKLAFKELAAISKAMVEGDSKMKPRA